VTSDPLLARLIKVARLYYLYNLSQQQIADKLKVSRPGVSRILQDARDRGVVRIEIVDPDGNGADIERSLREKYGLKKAVVVPNEGASDDSALKQRLGMAAARVLDSLVREGSVIGISWGSTMQELVRHLNPRRVKDATVVQLIGGISRAEYDTHAAEITMKLADNYKAVPFLLPVPAIVDDVRVKEALMSDSRIARVLDLGRQAEIAVFSVGRLDHGCIMCRAEYFKKHEVDALLRKKAVGDIVSRIVTETGAVCSPELDARTVGIELDELKKRPFSIAVAGGREKWPVLRAGLLGGYFNTLVTDEETAARLLDEDVPGAKVRGSH
jgi:deoxyribonucleoside regulator